MIAAAALTAFLLAQLCAAQPLGPPVKARGSLAVLAGLFGEVKAWLGAGPWTAIWAEEGSVPDPNGKPNGVPELPGSGSSTDAGSDPDPDGKPG